ncbi:MAG: prolyl oligopeptidase family serine peptidase [Blastocatellia bacterium]
MQTLMTRVLAAALLAFSLSLSAFAQDAGQVMRLSVGFRTMKNSVKMDEAKRKEVEALEAKARAATGAQKYGEAYKHYSQAMALMRGQPWTPSRALGAALSVKSERLVFDPGDAVRLTLTQYFVPDEPVAGKLSGSLELKNSKANFSKELKSLREVAADFSSPVSIEAAIPEVADGDYQMILTLKPAAGEPIVKPMPIRIARGLKAQSDALKVRAAGVSAKLKARKKESLIEAKPAVDLAHSTIEAINTGKLDIGTELITALAEASAVLADVVRQDELLLAMPAVEYAASMIDLVNAGQIAIASDVKNALANASASLDQIARGEQPLRSKRGDIHWAYRSNVDSTLQPYRLFIPSYYDASKKWPLVVALHGMGGDENSFFNGYENGALKRMAESRGYLVVCPKGRQPTSMYLGPAEKDVIDVLAEIKREYSIDDDRVYLTGHSMGGYGTWSVAANHPDLFAALAPFAGGGMPQVVMKLRTIAHIPWIVVHGDADPTVSVEESRRMVKAGKDLGIEIKYIEVPGGNHGNIVVPAFRDVFDWFDAHKRQAKPAVKAAGSGQ